MVILNKADLQAVFSFLALAFIFDSIPSGYPLLGLIGFLVLVVFVVISRNDYSKPLKDSLKSMNPELLVRAGVVLTFVGIVLANAYVLLLGFLIGSMLLFLPIETLDMNLFWLKLNAQKQTKQN